MRDSLPGPPRSRWRKLADLLVQNWKVTLPAVIVAGAVGAWLLFGFFGVQTLFVDDKVDEALPAFSSGAGASGLPSDALSEEAADSMNKAMDEENRPASELVDEPMPVEEVPEVIILVSGPFVDRSHPTLGTAKVITDGSDQRFLRFEDFRTDNGPDLNVYLSTAAPDAPAGEFDDDFVDLGDLKGNIGDQNYEIPAGVDLDRYSTVVIWCVRFGVAFGAAPLGA